MEDEKGSWKMKQKESEEGTVLCGQRQRGSDTRSLVCKCRNKGSEACSNLPEVTQPETAQLVLMTPP